MPYDFPKLSPAVSAPFSENAAKLAALFPSVVKDGKLDLDELRAQLGEFDEVGREKYGLTWAGKSDAQKKTGEALVGKTLKYIEADSKNPDTTQNIYIEGDNLEALKLLQNAYRGKIKMIYIDPPYNTGNDFVYNDTFAESANEAAVAEGDAAVVEGKIERYTVNSKTNGKYHANWLSMMYPRLQLARNLLSEDGVIFISIDDNEQANLKALCDEIFGEDNFVAQITIVTGANQSGDGVLIQKNVEYCLVYSKNIGFCRINRVDKTDEGYRALNDSPTPFSTRRDMGYTIYYNPHSNEMIPKMDYDESLIETNDSSKVYQDDIELIKL